jgi:cytochrome c-type biogenesis protein
MASITQLGLSVVAGSLTTLSPCVFPLLPIVVGTSLKTNKYAPVAMGIGMAISFAVIGVLLGVLSPLLGIESETIRLLGALLLIIFGTVMLVPALDKRFTNLISPIATSANNVSGHIKSDSLWGSLGMGALLGLVWSPCSGPILASALTLVATEGSAIQGGIILGLFGIGAAIPLVMVAYASRAGFDKARTWIMLRMELVKKLFGWLILVAGVLILSGGDKWIEARVVNLLPDWWTNLITL